MCTSHIHTQKGVISDGTCAGMYFSERVQPGNPDRYTSDLEPEKLKQADSEFVFPVVFVFVPWMHHVLIM